MLESEPIGQDALHQALGEDALVVTANQRLARSLHQSYAAARSAQNQGCWATPRILPWGAWLQNCWDDALTAGDSSLPARVLLNPQQGLLLWQKVIRRKRPDQGILNIQATASSVAQAWALMHAWQMRLPTPADYPNEDAAAFCGFAQDFQRECERLKLLDAARLPQHLTEICEQDRLVLPAHVLLLGFDEISPQQRALFTEMTQRACLVDWVHLPTHKPQARRAACLDSLDELARAAGWARACLSDNPQARIGIVVPDLHARRAQVERVFADVLHPEQLLPGAGREQRCFNISLGLPLAQSPMVRTALNILRLALGRIDAQQLGSLLRSPYVGAGFSEADGRAQLDRRLRERGDYEVWLADMLGIARRTPSVDDDRVLAPRFLEQLERLFVHHRAATGKHPCHEWAARFSRCLQAMQWPGERKLSSDEYQQMQAWQDLLERFVSLDLVAEAMPLSAALAQLNQLAAEQLFQPRTPWRPVQILGLLEATGQRFEQLWVCGMDDENWPPPARPNPWLPLRQQRELGMPHAHAEREFQQARAMTQAFAVAAPQMIFSFASREGDRQRQCSPLISEFAQASAADLAPADIHLFRDLVNSYESLTAFVDVQAPPLPAGALRGGSGVLAAQAACPFQAFGRFRLNARALEEVSIGPDARERGLLLHQALQKIFSVIGSQVQLRARSEPALRQLLGEALEDALGAAIRKRPRTYTPRFVEVEKRVVGELLFAWLMVERAREDFTVQAREKPANVTLSGLEFQVYLDRIDRNAAGEMIILDYKTGQVSASQWEGARPEAPQLPLYALAMDEFAPGALAFAQIRPDNLRFVGCAREDVALPGVKGEDRDAWQARIQDWRETLAGLAGELRAGQAAVAPKNRQQTCRYCDLTPLCRIHEADDNEDEETPT